MAKVAFKLEDLGGGSQRRLAAVHGAAVKGSCRTFWILCEGSKRLNVLLIPVVGIKDRILRWLLPPDPEDSDSHNPLGSARGFSLFGPGHVLGRGRVLGSSFRALPRYLWARHQTHTHRGKLLDASETFNVSHFNQTPEKRRF